MSDIYVLDSSAVLAIIFGERGSERVESLLDRARISAVNHQEVIAKQIDGGATDQDIVRNAEVIDVEVLPFDRAQAEHAGRLRRSTRAAGLSLGDRSCLALASSLGATVVTADRTWAKLDVGVHVLTIR